MKEIYAKRIVQANNNFNLYKGCSHGCIYCDSRSLCYQIDAFDEVSFKKDAILLMNEELRHKRQKAILTTGGMSDPYVHLEEDMKLTKQALEVIYTHGFGVALLTKSTMVLRDIELIEKINQKNKAIVQMTLTTLDDQLASLIEPNVSLPTERLLALQSFSNRGITTGVWLAPVLPFITDSKENIIQIIKACKQVGVSFIIQYGMGTTMRDGSREYFYKGLSKHFPHLLSRYQNIYKTHYVCPSPHHLELMEVFEKTCEAEGILYKSEDIKNIFTSNRANQPTLFD
jgi:DNA repair photolyase